MKINKRKFIKQLGLLTAAGAVIPTDVLGIPFTTSSTFDYDIIVAGGGISGIAATVAAARKGARVLLIEQDTMLGGSWIFTQNLSLKHGRITGIYKEIFTYLNQHHSLDNNPDEDFETNPSRKFRFFHKTAYMDVISKLFRGLRNVTVMRNSTIINTLISEGNLTRVEGVVYYEDGQIHTATAKVIIDATSSGFVASRAGCEMMFGTEAKTVFNEEEAPAISNEQVLPAFFQMVIHRTKSKATLPLSDLPGNVFADKIGEITEGTLSSINKDIQGIFLWMPMELNLDPREGKQWSDRMAGCFELLDDVLVRSLEKNGFSVEYPSKIGVRESSRVRGEIVLTTHDINQGLIGEEPIFIHNKPVGLSGNSIEWNLVSAEYGIPYRCLIPRGFDKMLCCAPSMSGSHQALTSYMYDNCVCAIAEAAGVAAALSIYYDVSLREVYNINEFRCFLFERDLMPY